MPRAGGKKNHAVVLERAEDEAVAFIDLFTVLNEIYKQNYTIPYSY